jgi:CheY-like chemotaxis protein
VPIKADPKQVLLVEDNSQDVELIRRAMAECNRTVEVVVTPSGGSALDYLFRRGAYAGRTSPNPALVLLDLKMAETNGFEVLRQVKSDPQLRSIPVVVVTSSVAEIDMVRSYAGGANSFLVKSIDYRQFVEALKRIVLLWA